MLKKERVLECIKWCLDERMEMARKAALQAYEQATSQETIAENKYDTFGLEASYLAHGQSQRVIECENDVSVFSKEMAVYKENHSLIRVGSLVALLNQDDETIHFFISPVAGGTNLVCDGVSIMLLSMTSPMGNSLLGKEEGDEIELNAIHTHKMYEIEYCL
ncbi:GreA/GreB family elongation factor [Marinomonas sp. 2405UD68-3]|uniref:GreA/GreB family elongation factor n=1 Tax=Marinomonas sp. 2405UD68-3 TaxID=3391835 RepID=UPI0039C9D80A